MKAEILSDDLKVAIGALDIAQSQLKSDYARIKTSFNPDKNKVDMAVLVAGDRVAIEHLLPLECDEVAEFGFPISKLKSLALNPPAPVIKLANMATGISLKCGTFKSKIVLPLLESCPTFQYELDCEFTVKSAAMLAGALKKIKGSIYTDLAGVKQAARKIIDGVMFLGDGTHLKLYSTDNNRLAKSVVPSSLVGSFVIPKDAVIATHQLLDIEDNTTVFIGLRTHPSLGGVGGVRIVVGKSRLTCGVIAGEPPNVDEFFSRALSNSIELDANLLKKSVTRLIDFSEEKAMSMSIQQDGVITLSTASPLAGEAQETINGSANVGESRIVKINAGYLLDACGGAGRVIVENNDSIVRVTHIDCPFSTQHVVAQLRQ